MLMAAKTISLPGSQRTNLNGPAPTGACAKRSPNRSTSSGVLPRLASPRTVKGGKWFFQSYLQGIAVDGLQPLNTGSFPSMTHQLPESGGGNRSQAQRVGTEEA
jgi:hypothetical protein